MSDYIEREFGLMMKNVLGMASMQDERTVGIIRKVFFAGAVRAVSLLENGATEEELWLEAQSRYGDTLSPHRHN